MALFDFPAYIEELRENEQKKDIIEKYESFYGPISPDITKQVWYSEYVKRFQPYYPKEGFAVPEDLEDDFDWELLFALTVSSYSSEYRFVVPEEGDDEKWRLLIKVSVDKENSQEPESIEKAIDELWSFQILRLYEIYVLEQMEMAIVFVESAGDEDAIEEFSKLRSNKLKLIRKKVREARKLEDEDGHKARELVYHYTSVSTLTEILKSNRFRATDLRFLNDLKEKKIWYEVFSEATLTVSAHIKSKPNSDDLEKILDEIVNRVNAYRSFECYIVSLSKLSDDKNQFQMYGDGCKGVSIGFDRDALVDMLWKSNERPHERKLCSIVGMLHGYVEYDAAVLKNDAIKLIEEALDLYESSGKSVVDFFDSVQLSKQFNDKCNDIFMCVQDAKDETYKSEEEYRLYYMQICDRQQKKVDFFSRKNKVIPFVNLEFGEKKMPIAEIIVGPLNTEENMFNIREVLKMFGYTGVVVKKSRIPMSY